MKNTPPRYANFTDETRRHITAHFHTAIKQGAEVKQAIAIAAVRGLDLSTRQWNSGVGDDAFASACAVLIMNGELAVKPKPVENRLVVNICGSEFEIEAIDRENCRGREIKREVPAARWTTWQLTDLTNHKCFPQIRDFLKEDHG